MTLTSSFWEVKAWMSAWPTMAELVKQIMYVADLYQRCILLFNVRREREMTNDKLRVWEM